MTHLDFFKNYEYIKKQVELGIYKGNDTSDTGNQSELEHNQIIHEDFQKAGLRNLFGKLDTLSNQAEKDRAISHISKNPDSSGLIRIILFSHYVLEIYYFNPALKRTMKMPLLIFLILLIQLVSRLQP